MGEEPSWIQVDKGALWQFQLFNTGRNRESALWSYFLQNALDPVQVPLLRFFVGSVVAATAPTMVHGGVEENRGGASGKDQLLDLDIDQI